MTAGYTGIIKTGERGGNRMPMRTDLAIEAAVLAQDGRAEALSGVRQESEQEGEMTLTRIIIENEEGAEALGRPLGTYITAELPPLTDDEEGMEEKAKRLGEELRALLPPEGAVLVIGLFYWYFGTEQGSALRATGSNPAMSRAQGIHIETMKVIGLGLSNGMVALAGGLMTQYQGTADVNMGRGAIVIGPAAIIIGEVLCDAIFKKGCNFAVRLAFVVLGGVIYYAVMVIILWLRLDPNDLKLFTAIIVAIFLAVPHLQAQAKSSFSHAKKMSQQGRSKRSC